MINRILKNKYPLLCLFGIAFLLNSFAKQDVYNVSYESKKYLEEVIKIIQTNSINKNKIDWVKFKEDVFHFAQNSQTIKDTYPAVSYAVSLLEDNHSYFSPLTDKNQIQEEKLLPILKDEMVPSDIGYIRIPFCIGNDKQTTAYIKLLTDKISAQNNPNIKGWVVDLRDNFGGNMWPMLVSVGPLLQTGIQGYFFNADNAHTKWYYDNGKAYLDSTMLAENKHIVTVYGKSKIAVLINENTASSGEAIAVLFKGYSTAKLFGKPTFGVSTGCESYSLSDGSRINLATSVFADRNKNKYGNTIVPDIFCNDLDVLAKALEWIYN